MPEQAIDDDASTSLHATRQPAPFWRRLAAMLYDSLIVIALLMLATAIALPFNQGAAFGSGNVYFQVYLALVGIGFFLLFWRKGGQTLGMRAWKIQLVNNAEAPPSYSQLLLRLLTAAPSIALLGLGVLWSVFDREKLAVHDRLSGTRLVLKLN